jgi:biofilm PGA synthesis protein PgaA
VLSWAGRDREALRRFAALGVNRAPAYAVAAAAVSARRTGQTSRAIALYRRAIAGGEAGTETRLGLALSLAATGNAAAARATLAQSSASDPGNPRIAQVSADIARPAPPPAVLPQVDAALAARRPFEALLLLEPALRAAPRDAALRRRQALALAAAGAPELALARGGDTLNAEERRRIEGAAHAFLVRWGAQVASPTPRNRAARHARTDAAIAALEAAIAAWTPLPEAAGAVRNARLDRLVALRDRGRMADVLAEAAALREQGELPGYAREAVGDALMDARRPAEAEAEYRAALEADPGSLTATLGLFYALSEQRRWAEARAITDRLERDIPAFLPLRGPEPPAENWDRIDAVTAAALRRIWGDDLAGAEAIVGPLAAAAPMNSSLRALRGDIWRLRGWTDRALEEYETALTNGPDALDLRIGHAEALLDARRWREARAAIAALSAEFPENAAVRRLARRLARHDMREFELAARGGLERGARDPEFDLSLRLYSAPIAEDWRLFAGTGLRTGDTPSGRLTTWRALAGLEWRGPRAVVTAGATLDREGVDRGGAFLTLALRLSDQWRIEAAAEATAADTPLAALAAGIHADAASLGLTWRHSDLREAAASVRVMRFSDDNTRLIGFARIQERVLNEPDWKLDLQPYAYATRNSREGAPYFNPDSDLELGLTAALTWIAWKRYDPELRIRLAATGGSYWQQGFGWSPVIALRWENQHALTDTLSFSYGAGWVRRDYDGRAEESASMLGALRWRF